MVIKINLTSEAPDTVTQEPDGGDVRRIAMAALVIFLGCVMLLVGIVLYAMFLPDPSNKWFLRLAFLAVLAFLFLWKNVLSRALG